MKVSVIIPVHQTICYFRECIDSILSQTHKNIEIIIACNGDLEIKQCRQYVNVDDYRIKYIKTKNGRHNARNEALLHATGIYIQYLDYDDVLFPDKIKTQLFHLQQKSLNSVSIVKWKKFRTDINEYYNFPFLYLFDDFYIAAADLVGKLGSSKGFLATSSWLLPKDLIIDLYWIDSPNDDAVFFSELCKKKPYFIMIPETLAGYRIHSSNTSSIRTKEEFNKIWRSWKIIGQNLSGLQIQGKNLYMYNAYLNLITYSKQIKKYKLINLFYYAFFYGLKTGVKVSVFTDLKNKILK